MVRLGHDDISQTQAEQRCSAPSVTAQVSTVLGPRTLTCNNLTVALTKPTPHHWQLVSALTSRTECHCTPYHWRAAQGPHHYDPAAAPLAPGPWTSHFQARLVGFQGIARSVAAVSRGWLSAACWYRAPSTPIVWHCGLICRAYSLISPTQAVSDSSRT